MLTELIYKIRSLERRERSLEHSGRMSREDRRFELVEVRRKILEYHSRLKQEVEAIPRRRLNEIAYLLVRERDPERRKELHFESARIREQIMTLDPDREIERLLNPKKENSWLNRI